MMRSNLLRASVILLVGFFSFPSIAKIIDKITIEGNTKTQTEIILQELQVSVGEDASDADLEHSRQLVMDLGLFEKVEFFDRMQEGMREIVFIVKEKKHDWYVLPRLDRNGDGDITFGINWRETNLFGLNQSSRFTIAQKSFDDATKDKETRLKWSFSYPRIVNTQLSSYAFGKILQVGLDEQRNGESGIYDRDQISLGAGVGRWFGAGGVSKGYQGDLGLELTRYDHEYISGQEGFFDDATLLSVVANVRYSQVQDLLYSRDGHAMGIRLQKSSEAWGSDRNFFFQELYYRRYIALGFREHTNLNIQFQLGRGDNSVFGDPIYELSGDRTLRGFPRETLEGDAYLLLNTEFLTPMFGKKNIRGGGLLDVGNAYRSLGDAKHDGLEVGLGVSFRWKFKQWVNTELRLDYARGLGDEGGSRFYIASESTF